MKYYQIGVSFDPKIIGVKNGIYQVVLNLDIIKEDKDFEFFFEFFDYHKNINFFKRQNEIQFINIPIIEGFLIHKAKLTDVMGYSKNISFLNGIFSDNLSVF